MKIKLAFPGHRKSQEKSSYTKNSVKIPVIPIGIAVNLNNLYKIVSGDARRMKALYKYEDQQEYLTKLAMLPRRLLGTKWNSFGKAYRVYTISYRQKLSAESLPKSSWNWQLYLSQKNSENQNPIHNMRSILFFIFIAIPWSTNAQSLLIGKVVDENGNAIPNAFVINMKTNQNLLADDYGVFSINAKQGEEIRVLANRFERQSKVLTADDFKGKFMISLLPAFRQ